MRRAAAPLVHDAWAQTIVMCQRPSTAQDEATERAAHTAAAALRVESDYSIMMAMAIAWVRSGASPRTPKEAGQKERDLEDSTTET